MKLNGILNSFLERGKMTPIEKTKNIILDFLDSECDYIEISFNDLRDLEIRKDKYHGLVYNFWDYVDPRGYFENIPLENLLNFLESEIEWDTEVYINAVRSKH